MKPRLPCAQLTTEDLFIWGDRWGGFRTREYESLALISKVGDRNDAELMLDARTRLGPGPMCIESADCDGEFIDCCGAILGSKLWHAPVST
jgi:hypothetical protein